MNLAARESFPGIPNAVSIYTGYLSMKSGYRHLTYCGVYRIDLVSRFYDLQAGARSWRQAEFAARFGESLGASVHDTEQRGLLNIAARSLEQQAGLIELRCAGTVLKLCQNLADWSVWG